MMNRLPYGWRGKLGLVYIASAWSMEAEYADMAPTGVTTHTTRIALSENPDCFSVDDVSNLGGKVVEATKLLSQAPDRKSTRLNSSHVAISYAVFCLKKKKIDAHNT